MRALRLGSAVLAACALAHGPALAANHYPLTVVGGQEQTLPAGTGLQVNPATPANPSINIPCAAGVAPTSPQDGDEWCTSAGLFIRVGGLTIGPMASAGVTSFNTRTGSVTLASGDVSGAGGLLASNNLSDLGNVSTARSNLGVAIGSNVEAWSANLDAVAALSTTGEFYYLSAANSWSPVTVGTGLTFTGGTLAASGGGGAGTVTTTGSPASGSLAKFSGPTSITNGDLTGDVSTSGSLVTTLANTAVTAGTYTYATVTFDAKGRATSASSGSVSGLNPRGWQLYDGTNYYVYPGGVVATVPVASAFSWVNQGAATETASGGQLLLADTVPTASPNVSWRLRVKSVSAKTTLIAVIVPTLLGGNVTNPAAGVVLRESATGKLLILQLGYDNSGTSFGVGAWSFTSATAFNAVRVQTSQPIYPIGIAPTPYFLKWVISGSTTVGSISFDFGGTWQQVYSASFTTNFTSGPDQWGYGVDSQSSSLVSQATLLSFVES